LTRALFFFFFFVQGALAGFPGYKPPPSVYEAGWPDFSSRCEAYIIFQNPQIKPQDARRQAIALWLAAEAWPQLGATADRARRLAALGGVESQYRLLAYIPGSDPGAHIPRTDALGTHYITLARAFAKMGYGPKEWRWLGWKKIKKTGHWKQAKTLLIRRPDVGTYIAGWWWGYQAARHRVDGAVRTWQSGTPRLTESGSAHVLNVRAEELRFMKINPRREAGQNEEEFDETPDALSRDPGGILFLLGRFRREVQGGLRGNAGAGEGGASPEGAGRGGAR